jgi:hypothetical protein
MRLFESIKKFFKEYKEKRTTRFDYEKKFAPDTKK